jgi:flagellin-like protein
MQLKQTLQELHSTEDRAVSPVIGVILMVAITVILAAVIASFVLGLGPSEAAPSAQFEFEETSTGPVQVTITHTTGDKIEAQYLYVRGSGVDGSWETGGTGFPSTPSYGSSSEIGSGDSVTVEPNTPWDLSVVWEKDDQSSELASQSAS